MLSRLMTVREQLLLLGVGAALITGSVTAVYLRASNEPEIIPVSEAEPQAKEKLAAPAEAQAAPPAPPAGPGLPMPSAVESEPVILTVEVQGAVHSPGIYDFPEKSRINDLLEAAGGPLPEADLSDISQIALLMDGTTLNVPYQPVVERGENTLRMRRPPAVYNPPQYTRSGAMAESARTAAGPQPSAAVQNVMNSSASPAPATGATSGLINLNTADQTQLETLPGIGPALAQRIIEYRQQTPFRHVDDLNEVSGIGDKRLEAIRSLVTVE